MITSMRCVAYDDLWPWPISSRSFDLVLTWDPTWLNGVGNHEAAISREMCKIFNILDMSLIAAASPRGQWVSSECRRSSCSSFPWLQVDGLVSPQVVESSLLCCAGTRGTIGDATRGNTGTVTWYIGDYFNSLWPSDAIWWHRSGSTLAQVRACCLTAPSHYLNQCRLIISEVLWHSPEGNFPWNMYDIDILDMSLIAAASPRGQWVNSLAPGRVI